MKNFIKPVGFFFVVVVIFSGIVYAAVTINTVTPQSINVGDIIGIWWFQAANDRLPPLGWNAWDVLVIDSSGKPSWGCGGGAGCAVVPVIPNSCATTPVFSYLGTLTTGTPTSIGQSWIYSVIPWNCTYVCTGWYTSTGCATAPIPTSRYPWCDTDDIIIWNQTWSACNVGATIANENTLCIDVASCTTARVWNYYNWDNAILSTTCSNWYHLPIKTEWKYAHDLFPNNILGNANNLANKLKLPLAGYKIYNSSYNMGNHSMYWSATTDTVYTTNAFFLEIWSTGDIGPTNSIDRMWESSVRCIKGTAPIIPNSCANNPVFTNLGTTTTGTPTSVGQAWTYSATPGNCTYVCTGGYSGTNCATAPIFTNRYPWCDTDDLVLSNGQIWSMCNVWASTNGNVVAAYGNYYSFDTTLYPNVASAACATWYHLPSHTEWQSAFAIYSWLVYGASDNLAGVLQLPLAYFTGGGSTVSAGSYGFYWSSTPFSSTFAYSLTISTGYNGPNSTFINPNRENYQGYGYSIRCIKN